jgi:hypothetical protein
LFQAPPKVPSRFLPRRAATLDGRTGIHLLGETTGFVLDDREVHLLVRQYIGFVRGGGCPPGAGGIEGGFELDPRKSCDDMTRAQDLAVRVLNREIGGPDDAKAGRSVDPFGVMQDLDWRS